MLAMVLVFVGGFGVGLGFMRCVVSVFFFVCVGGCEEGCVDCQWGEIVGSGRTFEGWEGPVPAAELHCR